MCDILRKLKISEGDWAVGAFFAPSTKCGSRRTVQGALSFAILNFKLCRL